MKKFDQDKFLQIFESITPLERAVFAEAVYDLSKFAYRTQLMLPSPLRMGIYLHNMVPNNRKLNKLITDHYDLTNKKHWRAYYDDHIIILGFLKLLGVVGYSKYMLYRSKIKLVIIQKDTFKEFMDFWKTRDEKELKFPLYEIEYSQPDVFLKGVEEKIVSTRYESQVEKIFEYVLNHPNKDITRQEIMNYYKNRLDKPLKISRDMNDVFEDMGFVGDLGKVFIRKKTKELVHFRNPVYYSDLKEMGLKYIEPAELLASNN